MILGYTLEELRITFFAVAAVLQTLFVILYLTFPWYATFLGRALFGKALVLAVTLDIVILARLIEIPYVEEIFTALSFGLVLGIFAQLVAFLKVRIEERQYEVSGNAPTHEERRW
jgi:hypothetical protein